MGTIINQGNKLKINKKRWFLLVFITVTLYFHINMVIVLIMSGLTQYASISYVYMVVLF